MKRDFFFKNEGSLTVIQMIGFVILVVGVIGVIVASFRPFESDIEASMIAGSFFVTMLGLAFAFPSLLEGNEGLSTMRITVFMMTDVICMLLLKIGWSDSVDSLEDIGLDATWMGVIAFVFGAKATQSFFESRFGSDKAPAPGTGAPGDKSFTNAQIAKAAREQNAKWLHDKFPNILEVSSAVKDAKEDLHVVTIYLKDENTKDIPLTLTAKMDDGSVKTIPTQIIKDLGDGEIHIHQLDKISFDSKVGSICCTVITDNKQYKAVSAGHVFSRGRAFDYGGELGPEDHSEARINNKKVGEWFFQKIDETIDLALADIDTPVHDALALKLKGHYNVSDADVQKTKVMLKTQFGTRDAYIVDYDTEWDVPYKGKIELKKGVILIGNTPDRETCKTVSQPGDSGGCVYEPGSMKLVGLILGGNKSYTWVLPLEDVFTIYSYSIADIV